MSYPFDWGFIPKTRGDDGDPVDAMILSDVSTYPGVVLQGRVAGMLELVQTDAGKKPQINNRVLLIPSWLSGRLEDASDLRRLFARKSSTFSSASIGSPTSRSECEAGHPRRRRCGLSSLTEGRHPFPDLAMKRAPSIEQEASLEEETRAILEEARIVLPGVQTLLANEWVRDRPRPGAGRDVRNPLVRAARDREAPSTLGHPVTSRILLRLCAPGCV